MTEEYISRSNLHERMMPTLGVGGGGGVEPATSCYVRVSGVLQTWGQCSEKLRMRKRVNAGEGEIKLKG